MKPIVRANLISPIKKTNAKPNEGLFPILKMELRAFRFTWIALTVFRLVLTSVTGLTAGWPKYVGRSVGG